MDSRVTSASLLGRARQSDPRAWSEMVDLYGPLIAHWCRRCGLDSHAAADCTQDVFAAVSRSLNRFRSQKAEGSFRAWLWTITSNKIKDRMRSEARDVRPAGGSTAMRRLDAIPDAAELPGEEPTESVQVSELMTRGLRQIRSGFAEKTWRIFERAVIDGIATSQVADEFSVTAATVRQTRSRVLRRLREHLGELE